MIRLRSGVPNLGRKRLLEAFDTVRVHFERLFKSLFGQNFRLELATSLMRRGGAIILLP